MKRKVFSLISLAVLTLVGLTGCTRIGPGHVGIVVDMAGSNKGVLDKPVRTGWVFYSPVGQSVIEYPTYMQTAKWTKNTDEGKPIDESVTFTNKDSMSINADISLSYTLSPDKAPAFYVKFLATDQDGLDSKFTHGFLRNVARDCFNEHAGKYTIEQIMGDNAQFLKDTRECVQSQITPFGITLEQFGFIGAPRPPENVIQAINMKAQAQQLALQKQMELQQVQADAAKQIAAAEGNAKSQIALADGEAEANRKLQASITAPLLEWRKLNLEAQAISKWNGQRPQVEGGNSGLLLNIPTGNK